MLASPLAAPSRKAIGRSHRPFETEAGQGAENIVGLFEYSARGGVRLHRGLAHAGELRPLTGEKG
jgi:hypothetical protein